MYYRARYYDPTIGRFISRDPIGLQGGLNQYAYVGNNPINANDPSGQWALNGNLGVLGGAIGIDDKSGQPFWKFRVGLVGLGVSIDPSSNAPLGEGKFSPGECTFCTVNSVSWKTGNIGAGATVGPISWQPIKYDLSTVVTEKFGGKPSGAYVIPGQGLTFDPLNFQSVFNPKENTSGKGGTKGGVSIDLEANFETGATVPWSDIRNFFGVSPSKLGEPSSVVQGSGSSGNQTMSGVSPH